MAQVNCIQLIFCEEQRQAAYNALVAQGINPGAGVKSWTGPTFRNCKAKFTAFGLHITTPEGATYTYPAHTINRVKEYTEEVADAC